MVMHSILITNANGQILLTRYFDAIPDISSKEGLALDQDRDTCIKQWEDEVRLQTRSMWHNALDNNQVAQSNNDAVTIVYRRIGDLIIFACGQDECDELTLVDVVDCLGSIIGLLCEESKVVKPSETWLLAGDVYAKVSLTIDEMMPNGILEILDAEIVFSMVKMKPIL